MPSLLEDSGFLLSASIFHVTLVEVYEENLASYRYISWKKDLLIAFHIIVDFLPVQEHVFQIPKSE